MRRARTQAGSVGASGAAACVWEALVRLFFRGIPLAVVSCWQPTTRPWLCTSPWGFPPLLAPAREPPCLAYLAVSMRACGGEKTHAKAMCLFLPLPFFPSYPPFDDVQATRARASTWWSEVGSTSWSTAPRWRSLARGHPTCPLARWGNLFAPPRFVPTCGCAFLVFT